jgi:hypothetical protein
MTRRCPIRSLGTSLILLLACTPRTSAQPPVTDSVSDEVRRASSTDWQP